MSRVVALLRGINVGGHRKVPMADLRELAGEIGFRDVRTYIQSGNLVLAADVGAPDAATQLEGALERRFGFHVDVVARTAVQWARYAAGSPFPEAAEAEPNRVMLLLSKAAPSADAAAPPPPPPRRGGAGAPRRAPRGGAPHPRARDGERVAAAGDAVWGHYAGGAGTSKLTPALIDRALGSPTTARNWTTVLALHDLLRV